ncbi:biotin-dependent carboxyltransferase family protein [Falsirhodobacter halotolerans]|uniref:5-oxoprolinase subunit C family protein n=1 Tax=Falsirhodobacter halotolerans TaxID=1146892 RepID=UPI001FD54D4D|nr:biotin-dependent carboxyltransferase family protein [Falsirhodobacter halotolerans]MCJ8140874.1 biotin-dependent carboxyltransferase family protein [Falsirhodobacter halotolerans]
MIEVVTPGPMLTVQDAGRFGLRHAGISSAGPMDRPAHALANVLVGNAPTAAALEFAGFGGTFRAHVACRIAVGGTVPLRIDGADMDPARAHRLEAGSTLTLGPMPDAVWGYLAVSGGIDVPPVLGSRSTHLRTGVGGGTLRAGQHLPLGPFDPRAPCLAPFRPLPDRAGRVIRAVPGPQSDLFAPDVVARFFAQTFTVAPARDRMAMTLAGDPLPARHGHDIVSDGTVAGSVQIPGSGQPLVLMAESQTTGGYPKMATVIGADLPRLAQLPTGATFRFAPVTRDAAEDIWAAHCRALARTLHPLRVCIARRRPVSANVQGSP